ncbi:MAG: DUF3071 domain-containing protein [Actinomycetales bacterium]|nr:DUF3071 domain-containing protein [Actinomycetales bacterium]
MGQGQMQLRLIGVHDSGEHLLLSDGDGGRYLLPLDETLKAAVRRDRPRLGQLQIEIDGAIRPREVQALIRTGLTPEEIADRTGWSVERIRRYEGPVLAEREHAARLAQQVYVRVGSDPLTLGERVRRRLHNRGVDTEGVSWDSVRSEEGNWTVSLTFAAGGRERTASWYFDLEGRSVVAADDEARWLSEDDTPRGPIPAPHPPAPDDDLMVFDVEADGAVASRRSTWPEPIDLMQAMRDGSARNRRRRRRGAGPADLPLEPSPDALPLEELSYDPVTMEDPPGARGPHPDDARVPTSAEVRPTARPDTQPDVHPRARPDLRPPLVPSPRTDRRPSGQPDLRPPLRPDGAPGVTRAHSPSPVVDEGAASTKDADAAQREGSADTGDQGATTRTPDKPGTPRSSRPKRPSVPSWDDIMFGSRPSDPTASG